MLLLDEPSNHLDIDSVDALIQGLSMFKARGGGGDFLDACRAARVSAMFRLNTTYTHCTGSSHPPPPPSLQGGVLIISHDEHLITAAADELWVASGDGRVQPYAGTFAEYKSKLRGAT